VNDQGEVEVNGKVVGIGYVLKREYMENALRDFEEHLKASDEIYRKAVESPSEVRAFRENHSRRGLKLLLKHIYLEEKEAMKRLDFEKLATIELAKRLPALQNTLGAYFKGAGGHV